jgi:hypothetical protein
MPTADPRAHPSLAGAAWRLAILAAAFAAAGCSSPDDRPEPAAMAAGNRPPDSAASPAASQPRDSAGTDSARAPAGADAPAATGVRLADIAAELDTTSARVDRIAARLDTVQRNVGATSRTLAGLRRDMRNGKLWNFLVFTLGVLAGGLGLPRLLTWWRTGREDAPSAPPPSPPPQRELDPETQARADRRREELEAERARLRPAMPPAHARTEDRPGLDAVTARITAMESSLHAAVRDLSDELRLVRDELRSRPRPDARAVVYGERGRDGRGGDLVAHDSEYRALPAGGGDRGPGERIQVLLNEEGIFVPYPERVSKPMAEILWRPGEPEAEGYILTSFLFSLDSRRLQTAYDVDNLDSGRYETVRPARVHWGEGRRGHVIAKGELRYVGT